MKIMFDLDDEGSALLSRMAREATLSTGELARIATLNLMAIWLREHGDLEVIGEVEVFAPPAL